MQEAQPLLIFPYNGNGIEALDCIGSAYRFIGFVDDTPRREESIRTDIQYWTGTHSQGFPMPAF